MAGTQPGVSGSPAGRRWLFLAIIWTVAGACGVIALAMAGWGWQLELSHPGNANILPGDPVGRAVDLVIRTVKVLLLSDIYYAEFQHPDAKWYLETARAFGVAFSLLIALRLLFYAIGARASDFFFRIASSKHDVIIGSGMAAAEYAASHNAMLPNRAIHLTDERAPTARRLATFARRGSLKTQLRDSVAGRARRIIIDEGDDADTWQTAQVVARECPDAEVLAHITDPWMRDRLSREDGKPGLAAFSYAGGAARQAMLAHPPYLLAEKLGASTQHVLIVGFGQVGQSLAREFIVTSLTDADAKMMVTIVDPEAERLEKDFQGRHEDLVKAVDFCFVPGDFRLNTPELIGRISKRNGEAAICAVYVAIDLERRPLGLALALRAMGTQKGIFRAPIFVCAQHGAGLPPVHQGAGLVSGAAEDLAEVERRATVEGRLCNLRVVSFGSWPEAFDGAGLLEREFDGQAKQFHRQYEKLRIEQEKKKNPAAVPQPGKSWEVLEDQFRVSNRRVAAHMRAKAQVAEFDLDTWLDNTTTPRPTHELPPAGDYFRIDDPNFMHRMAKFEHTRWMLDRYLDGWKYGEKKDNYMRLRPELVPFDKLDPDNVHKDDEVIRTTKALFDGVKSRGGRRN
jgi:hypothetical protein